MNTVKLETTATTARITQGGRVAMECERPQKGAKHAAHMTKGGPWTLVVSARGIVTVTHEFENGYTRWNTPLDAAEPVVLIPATHRSNDATTLPYYYLLAVVLISIIYGTYTTLHR